MPTLSYPGQDLTVTYDTEVCVHAGECVRGLPAVFDPNQDPWIQPDAAPARAGDLPDRRLPLRGVGVHQGRRVARPNRHSRRRCTEPGGAITPS